MTLYTYGGTPADVLTTTTGAVVPDYPLLVRRAGTGELVTALYEADGVTPIGELRTNPAGSSQPGAVRAFKIADITAIEYEYLDAGGQPVRWYEDGREVVREAATAAQGALSRADGGTVTGPLAAAGGITIIGGGEADTLDVAELLLDGVPFVPATLLPDAGLHTPQAYGATGDGVADDAPAVQAALDAAYAAGGGWVIVPPGDYRLATLPLRIWHRTRLTLMPGARFIRAADMTVLVNGTADQAFSEYTGHGEIIVEGGVWEMQGTTSGLTASRMCMSFGHAQNITIRDLTVRDLPGFHAVELNAIKTSKVLNCSFLGYVDPGGRDFSEAIQYDLAKGSAYFGAFGPYDDTPCVDALVDGCTVGPSGTPGTTSWPRGIGSHSASPGKPHQDIRIKNCRFEQCAQFAIGAYTWEGVVIEGVHMRDCGGGVRVRTLDSTNASHRTPAGGSSPTITGSQALTGFVISDLTFVGGGAYGAAVHLEGEDTGFLSGISLDSIAVKTCAGSGIRLISVEGYSLRGVNVAGAGGTGISTLGTRRGRWTTCHVNGAAGAGMTIDSRSTAAAAATNISLSNCSVTGAGANGFHVWDGADITLDNCAAYDLTGIGVQVSTNTVRPIIRDVRTRNTTGAGINLTSTVTSPTRRGNTADAGGPATVSTAANTASETVVGSWTIPAGDASVGVGYRFALHGTASTTGTPTLTLRVRLGGVTGQVIAAYTAITTGSGISARGWRVEGALHCVTTGASGTWSGGAALSHHLAATTGAAQHELADTPVTRDTTVDQALVVTAQWSAAAAANTASASAGSLQRVA